VVVLRFGVGFELFGGKFLRSFTGVPAATGSETAPENPA